jgi:hypothetical protein
MIDRIFKNWKSTALGLGVMAVGFILVWFEKATLTEFTAFIGGGLLLLFSKDGKNNASQ